MMTQGLDHLAATTRPAATPAPRARQYVVCHGPLPAAEAALGLQPAASAVSWGNSAVLVQVQAVEKCTIEQQSSSNWCDSARCTVRSSVVRSNYPRNRRVVQRYLPRAPACRLRLINICEQQGSTQMWGFARLPAPARAADASALHGQLLVAHCVGMPLPAAAFGPFPAASAVLLCCWGIGCAAHPRDSHCQGDLPSCHVPAIATHFGRSGSSRNSAAGTCAVSRARDEIGSGSLRSSSTRDARRKVSTMGSSGRQAEKMGALDLR